MDLLNWLTGLVLLAIASAAGVVAWNRSRRVAESQPDVDAAEQASLPMQLPSQAEQALARQAAARGVIEQARAHVDAQAALAEVVPAAASAASLPAAEPAMPQFDGPAWAATEPMPGMGAEPQFADTMPAEINFGHMSFADTEVTEVAIDEPPGPSSGALRQVA